MIIPPYLKAGDTIAITCPAGYMPAENAATCIETLLLEGYRVMAGETLGSASQNYFSGTDEERATEMQYYLDDKNIKAILCARGGYGMSRIIDRLDFKMFLKHPKWLIGFSDITVLHTHLYSRYKAVSLHAPMAAAFNNGGYSNEYIGSLLAALRGEKGNYHSAPHALNKTGIAKGKLIGGNLALLAHVTGTASDIKTKNCILFLEDIGEQLYNVDRMLYQLKRSGKLAHLAGLVIGGFTDMKDTEKPFGKDVYEIISEIIEEYDYPVCFGFPVSHETANVALKQGAKYKLSVNEGGANLKET
ncbi:MAG: LD-carboxypeptidase [Ferruginibacter sp.]